MIFCCNWNLFILRHIYWKIHMKGSKTKIKQESTNKFQKISYLDPFLLTLCWDNFIPICIYSKKSCIQETLNLSTDADRSTNIFFSFLNFVAGRKKFEGVQPFFGFFFSADEKNLTVNNNKKMRGPKKMAWNWSCDLRANKRPQKKNCTRWCKHPPPVRLGKCHHPHHSG